MDTLNPDDPSKNVVKNEVDDNSPVYLNHPIYLHPSDATGTTLVLLQLSDLKNYGVWSRAMYISLLINNKLGFIYGSCKKESFDPSINHLCERAMLLFSL